MIFVAGCCIMGMFGAVPRSEILKSGAVSLSGEPNYELEIVNVPLKQADSIYVKIATNENRPFSYVLLDEQNSLLYEDEDTRILANPIKTDSAITDSSFQETIRTSGNYSLVLYSAYFNGTNVSYSISVYRVDSSIMSYSVLGVTACGAIVFGILISERRTPTALISSYF